MDIKTIALPLNEKMLLPAIYGLIILSLAGFFLFATGKTNNFPTYLVGVLTLLFLASNRSEIRILRHSVVLISAIIFSTYMALSSLWSVQMTSSAVLSSFASMLLIFTLLIGMVICSRRFPEFIPNLVYCIVYFASLSAAQFLLSSASSDESTGAWGRLHAPSVAALVYGMATVMAVWSVFNLGSGLFKSIALLACGVLLTSCIILGVSYVTFALIMAGILMAGLYMWYRIGGRWLYICVALLPIVIVFFFLSESQVLVDRQTIWAPVLELVFQSQSAFGHGMLANVEPVVDCTNHITLGANGCVFDHPHNIYVSTMYQGGIVGLVLLVLLLVLSVSMTLESKDKNFVVLVLACLIYGSAVLMFDGQSLIKKVNFIWLVFWLPIGMAIVCEVLSLETTNLDFHEEERIAFD